MALIPLRDRAASHEERFASRYNSLLRIALGLTRGDRAAAEDLVHDAYIRFTFVRPDLRNPEKLDAYLGRMLTNLHLSRLRRAQRIVHQDLSIVEYDSAQIGVLAINPAAWTETRHSLVRLCEYGCLRRTSSKTGSVFLLRFFLGYVPSEIAAILRVSTTMIDGWLRLARQEARLFLEEPSHLRFAAPEATVSAASIAAVDSVANAPSGLDDDLLTALRAQIVATPHRRCYPQRTLERFYRREPGEAIETSVLAELIGCAACLARVVAMLGLPKASDRDPMDTLGPHQRSTGEGGSQTPAGRTPRRRDTRDLFEHQPKELRVLVNGFALGGQAVSEGDTQFDLAVNLPEPMGLVEVVSEQGLCLLYLEVDPPPNAPVEQSADVELSDGRRLSLAVRFADTWPSIALAYRRPQTAAVVDAQVGQSLLSHGTRPTDGPRPSRFSAVRAWLAGVAPQPRFSWRAVFVIGLLAWLFFATPFVEVSAAQHVARFLQQAVERVIEWARPAGPISTRPPVPSRPALVSGVAPTVAPARPSFGLSPTRAVASDAALMSVELNALVRLQHTSAYLGQEVSLGRTPDGRVRVEAVVGSESRRRALLDALGSMRSSALMFTVRNAGSARATRRPSPSNVIATPPREYTFAPDENPAFTRLRTYLLAKVDDASGSGAESADRERQLADEVNRLAASALGHSQRASQHAWALNHVMARFPALRIEPSSTESQAAWRSLVQTHARRYLDDIQQLRDDMEPVFWRALPLKAEIGDRPADGPSPDTALRLAQSARRLFELNAVQDEAFRALSVSSTAPVPYVLEDEVFWRQFDELVATARLLQEKGSSQ